MSQEYFLNAMIAKIPTLWIISQIYNTLIPLYKFTSHSAIIKDNVDMSSISEAKIDSSFPINQFNIDGYKT